MDNLKAFSAIFFSGETGPAYWSDLDSEYWLASNGKNQSPINIVTSNSVEIDLPDVQFFYEASALELENNGHTIEATPIAGSYIDIGGVIYNLMQFHFHSLSEHTINGRQFPLEGHFVHKNSNGDLAVIGVLIEAGEENENFKAIWEHIPAEADETYDLDVEINPNDLLPEDRRSYQYSGSLTTPPCSEGVRWFVLRETAQMSEAQLNKFAAIYNHNYRPVQAVNARQILFDSSN